MITNLHLICCCKLSHTYSYIIKQPFWPPLSWWFDIPAPEHVCYLTMYCVVCIEMWVSNSILKTTFRSFHTIRLFTNKADNFNHRRGKWCQEIQVFLVYIMRTEVLLLPPGHEWLLEKIHGGKRRERIFNKGKIQNVRREADNYIKSQDNKKFQRSTSLAITQPPLRIPPRPSHVKNSCIPHCSWTEGFRTKVVELCLNISCQRDKEFPVLIYISDAFDWLQWKRVTSNKRIDLFNTFELKYEIKWSVLCG